MQSLFANGMMKETRTIGAISQAVPESDLFIGNNQTLSAGFVGRLDEVMIFSHHLFQNDVHDLFLAFQSL